MLVSDDFIQGLIFFSDLVALRPPCIELKNRGPVFPFPFGIGVGWKPEMVYVLVLVKGAALMVLPTPFS